MTGTDRNDGYVPETPHYTTELRPSFYALVGNPYQDRHLTEIVPVALALPDELNRDSARWWWAQIDPGGPEDKEHWSHFRGHQIRVGVELRTWNERDVNDWKGRDEIIPAGYWLLTFNDEVVYGGHVGAEPLDTLLTIRRTAQRLLNLGGIDWRSGDYRQQIEGAHVYYKDTPAVLYHWMPEQGCVMVRCVDGTFPPHAYDIEHNYSADSATEEKIDLLSDRLWWWRKRLYPGDITDPDEETTT